LAIGYWEGEEYKVTVRSASDAVKLTGVTVHPSRSVVLNFDLPEGLSESEREVWITLPKSMIDGINLIQVPASDRSSLAGQTVPYEILDETDVDGAQTTVRFGFPAGASGVEILGATVVPEFPLALPLALLVSMLSIVAFSRFKNPWSL
jgi:hypothetical protein